jgi:hypothetical protein
LDNTDRFNLNLNLTREEFDTLILALGFATGSAFKQGMGKLSYSLLELANTINKDNPNWKPYEIPQEYRSGGQAPQNPDPESDRGAGIGRGKRKPGSAI